MDENLGDKMAAPLVKQVDLITEVSTNVILGPTLQHSLTRLGKFLSVRELVISVSQSKIRITPLIFTVDK